MVDLARWELLVLQSLSAHAALLGPETLSALLRAQVKSLCALVKAALGTHVALSAS